MAMKWLELSAYVESSEAEVVAEVFGRFASGGVAIEDASQRQARVRIFLPVDDSLSRKRLELEEALSRLALVSHIELLQSEIEEQEWEAAWRKHYHTLRLGERLVIKPAWEEYRARAGEVVIELDPGMAFGTGEHATTRLCLLALERHLRPGMVVLDLGTGSGVLAIAAAKLGAASVLALDTDPTAVGVARGNVEANGVAGVVTVEEGTLSWRGGLWQRGYDLTVANITAYVIQELSHPLVRSLKAGGVLIAGGIDGELEGGVVDGLGGAGARIVEVLAEDRWRAIVARAGEAG